MLRKALKRKRGGQTYVAGAVGCTRQTIWSLLQGNPIDCDVFMAVCKELELNWESIAVPEITEPESNAAIDVLVETVRKQVHDDIQYRCGSMQVLDMTQAIGLDAIYTTVNILENVTGRQRRDIAELLQECNFEELTRLGPVKEKRVPGLSAVEQHPRLMIRGKPGAGKTTFLKWIAIQCNNGQPRADQVPVFVTLKAFAEAKGQPDLLTYLCGQWADCGVKDAQTAVTLLNEGRVLLLLDGLDEVRDVDQNRVLHEIRAFSTRFRTCQFVMTCRIAAREYTFEQFTEVEVADFDNTQIKNFVGKWFAAKQDPVKPKRFLEKLRSNTRIRELATNPLLLTLLCWVFQESADFPTNRSELYREGLDVLLKKWDAKRNIERDALHQRSEIYQSLSLQRKEALLSHIAFTTFEHGDIFFKQQAVEQYIAQFILHLRGISNDPESLELDSEAILKSIEAQHGLLVERARGIYSFSHLTFQEYFTAKKIASSTAAQAMEALKDLAPHVTEKRWQEVFLLTVGILQPADDLVLLMKAQIDGYVAKEEKLQQFLHWANEKANSIKTLYKPAALRAYYSCLSLVTINAYTSDTDSALSLDNDFVSAFASAQCIYIGSFLASYGVADGTRDLNSKPSRNNDRDHDLVSDRDLNPGSKRKLARNKDRVRDLVSACTSAHSLVSTLDSNLNLSRQRFFDFSNVLDNARYLDRYLDRISEKTTTLDELEQALESLRKPLPSPQGDHPAFLLWWKERGPKWAEQFRAFMIQHRKIGHDWQFSDTQAELLEQYYAANKLLVDCLNSDCYVTNPVREEIEATLLLPQSLLPEIQKERQKQ